MGQHLVIDVFVALGGLNHAIEHKHPPKVRVLEYYQVLMICLFTVQDPVGPQGLANAWVEGFVHPGDGAICTRILSCVQSICPRRCSDTDIRPGVNALSNTGIVSAGLHSPHIKTSIAA